MDGPYFPPAPPRDVNAYRTAAPVVDVTPPRKVVRRPEPAREVVTAESFDEPDWLARALGPGRMPRIIVRFPRASGAGLVSLGVLGAIEIARLATDGGLYSRPLPVVTALALMLGLWLLLVGRPTDTRGYTAPWWNVGYVAILASSVVFALVVEAVWL